MKTIWKFPLAIMDAQRIAMPEGAEILSVQVQHREPCLWAKVNPDAPPEMRYVRTYGTGHPIDESEAVSFIGTYQLNGGNLVFHVFAK